MEKQRLVILAVCGSGVVSSTMIAHKIEEILSYLDVETKVIGLLPTAVAGYLAREHVDFVVTTSPIPGEINVPVILGVALLTGFGEKEVIEEIRSTAQQILHQG